MVEAPGAGTEAFEAPGQAVLDVATRAQPQRFEEAVTGTAVAGILLTAVARKLAPPTLAGSARIMQVRALPASTAGPTTGL